MPMPGPRLASTISVRETKDMQPSLLEERRSWVRRGREVKLDIFLSLAEEVMLELFEVGPPLPPSNYSSQEILQALDERFTVFNFSGYHHAFCHFLNLHIDQYASIEDFNSEFTTVLEDLTDYGHPLSNTQACSAYFSKLRCTQNPWVAKKLDEWDTLPAVPDIYELMRESLPWACIRPLRKSSQSLPAPPISEDHLGDTWSHLHSEIPGLSDSKTASSDGSHSRQLSKQVTHSQMIDGQVSNEDIELDPQDLREAIEKLLTSAEAEHSSLKIDALATSVCATPDWLNAQQKVAPRTLSIPGPPPPTASRALHKTSTTRARSASPRLPSNLSRSLSQASLTVPTTMTRPHTVDIPHNIARSSQSLPPVRSRTPTYPPPPLSDHPAFRDNPFLLTEQAQRDLVSTDYFSRPQPERRDTVQPHSTALYSPYQQSVYSSSNSSAMSLPLQGTSESSWCYTKDDGEDIQDRSIPLITSSMFLQRRNPDITTQQSKASLQSSAADIAALPSFTSDLGNLIPPLPKRNILRKASSSMDILKRLSGDSLLESSDEVREREEKKNKREKERKGTSWNIGVNIARFTHSKGVK
ncbi:uncharacterized protein ALTATR162_LOCUS1655 [Alternaria atra]|uniref:Uncharacterized protein n=1 Tax=Alternaria atra TaxID=119953 RepID=A0A8J2HUU0_9PLEO|nr:uncharacterized protein ALTATR162_LOCUS1655 [Alternaria atra]CAG5145112.1 unnamed protein product [Alternaria atra]